MAVLFVMLPAALTLAAGAIAAFVWAAKRGQFDDTDTPQHRMLFDDIDSRKAGKLSRDSIDEDRR